MEKIDRSVAPRINDLQAMQLPAVTRKHLPNGVELVILNHGQQPVNRLTVVWGAGNADLDNPATLRLLCQTVMEGTSRYNGGEIAEILEYNGAWMRMESGPHTTLLTLHSLNHTASEVFPLAADIVTDATYPDESFNRIRSKQAAALEIDMRKVANKAVLLGNKMLYGESAPMARVILPSDMLSVSAEDVRLVHRRLLKDVVPTIYLAGAVTPELEAYVADVFGHIRFGEGDDAVGRKIVAQPRHGISRSCWDVAPESMQTAVRMIIPSLERLHPDYEQLRFTVFVLGGYFGSRLMSNIREDKGYTYGISASLSASPEGGRVTITCQTDKSHTEDVLEEIDHEIRRLASEPVGEAELEVVKHTLMSGLTALLDSPFTIMDYHQQIDSMQLPVDYYARQMAELQRFDAASAMEMTNKYLREAPRLTALAGVPIENIAVR